jgi:two-component system CheB/CheR fusion protein
MNAQSTPDDSAAPPPTPADPPTAAAGPGAVKPSGADRTAPFPIVGIGASAGGLAAFEAFFAGMPADVQPGLAIVLVQHLAPDHTSILPEIVRRHTRLPVSEIADGMAVAVDHVYVIPPRWQLTIVDGRLRLTEPVAPRGQRLPIDDFFCSLARDRQEAAIAIVLSGTGSDGAQGVRAIKAAGGLVLVQLPQTAEHDGMPRAALATGAVDQELPPQDMAARLMGYAGRLLQGSLPCPPSADAGPERWAEEAGTALKRIFAQLRAKTRHDFSQYKTSTVRRRIHRRMAVQNTDTVDAYAAF